MDCGPRSPIKKKNAHKISPLAVKPFSVITELQVNYSPFFTAILCYIPYLFNLNFIVFDAENLAEESWKKMALGLILGIGRAFRRKRTSSLDILTSKRSPRGFYKGKNCKPTGFHTRKGTLFFFLFVI